MSSEKIALLEDELVKIRKQLGSLEIGDNVVKRFKLQAEEKEAVLLLKKAGWVVR